MFFKLYQKYPNPFNPGTKIRFDIPDKGNNNTVIEVYDISGRKLETLLNRNLNAGSYEVSFDGSKFATGIYFYTISNGNFKQVKKMILLK